VGPVREILERRPESAGVTLEMDIRVDNRASHPIAHAVAGRLRVDRPGSKALWRIAEGVGGTEGGVSGATIGAAVGWCSVVASAAGDGLGERSGST
jgi:hypothetical protein